MRVIAGEWRGRPLATPEGRDTRPTSDRAREGLFSMLASRVGSFDGLHAADLFAGTGSLGIEALSRGAAFCTFVDKDRAAATLIRRSLDAFGAVGRADIRTQGIEHAPPPRQPCDLLFLDPPYATGLAEMALARVANAGWVAPGGWVSVETAGERLALPAGFALDAERRFGKAHLTLFRRAG